MFDPDKYDNPAERWEGLFKVKPTDVFQKVWYPGCKGCIFAEPDVKVEDEVIPGYEKAMCSVFDLQTGKPPGTADGTAKCPYYEDEQG